MSKCEQELTELHGGTTHDTPTAVISNSEAPQKGVKVSDEKRRPALPDPGCKDSFKLAIPESFDFGSEPQFFGKRGIPLATGNLKAQNTSLLNAMKSSSSSSP